MKRWAIGYREFWTRRGALKWALARPSEDFEVVSMPVRTHEVDELMDRLDSVFYGGSE